MADAVHSDPVRPEGVSADRAFVAYALAVQLNGTLVPVAKFEHAVDVIYAMVAKRDAKIARMTAALRRIDSGRTGSFRELHDEARQIAFDALQGEA